MDFFSPCRKALRPSRSAECRKQGAQCQRWPGPVIMPSLLLACPSIFARNVVYPLGASPWSMRFQISFLFPQEWPGSRKAD